MYQPIGYYAPETGSPHCKIELDLGRRATSRLEELVATGSVCLEEVACSCRQGTEGAKACNLRTQLRGAKGRRARRGRNIDRGGVGSPVPMRGDQLSAHPESMVQLI